MLKDSQTSKWQNTKVTYSAFLKDNASSIKLIIFIIFSVLFFGAVTYKIILVPKGPVHEFDAHILAAVKMVQEGQVVLPHFLFQLLTIIHHYLLSFFDLPTYQITGRNQKINYDWGFSALIVMLEIYVGIGLLLVYHLKLRFKNNIKNFENLAYVVAFGISISCPIFLLAPVDGKFYLGYITPSTIYIIPTQVLLKLPSLALFLLSPLYFTKNKENAKILLTVGFLVVLSGLAKPNWLMVMIPALGIISLINIIKGCYVNWWALGVILLSSAAVLGWQYYFKFMDVTSPIYKSEIIITSPFEVWGHHSDFLLIKIILSILFPLYITIFFWKTVKGDFLLSYGWLLFLIGLIYTGFLGEGPGKVKFAGNFVWCGQIACFMLFVASASLFFSKCCIEYQKNKQRVIIGSALFCAHVVCGLIYYFRSFELSFV
jgi:hypothetical protein